MRTDVACPLSRLMELAHEVHVDINPQRGSYESIEDHLRHMDLDDDELAPERRAEIIRRGKLVAVQVYPETPVGFWVVVHWDPEEAVFEALERMEGG